MISALVIRQVLVFLFESYKYFSAYTGQTSSSLGILICMAESRALQFLRMLFGSQTLRFTIAYMRSFDQCTIQTSQFRMMGKLPKLIKRYDWSLLRSARWLPPVVAQTSCSINADKFPFDTQYCELRFGSWSYTKDKINLSHVSPTNNLTGKVRQKFTC